MAEKKTTPRPSTAQRAREKLAAWLAEHGFDRGGPRRAAFDAHGLIEQTRDLLRAADEDDADVRRAHRDLAGAVVAAHDLVTSGHDGGRARHLRAILASLPVGQLEDLQRVARDLHVKPPSPRTVVVSYWRAFGLFNDVQDVKVSQCAVALLLLAAGQAQGGDFEDALAREVDAVKHCWGVTLPG
jgi:hypothetical protein